MIEITFKKRTFELTLNNKIKSIEAQNETVWQSVLIPFDALIIALDNSSEFLSSDLCVISEGHSRYLFAHPRKEYEEIILSLYNRAISIFEDLSSKYKKQIKIIII